MENFECLDCEVTFVSPSLEDAICPSCRSDEGVVFGFAIHDDFGWDADVLVSVGWGTDEDYGYYGE